MKSLLCSILFTSALSAQEWQWAKTEGKPDSYDYGKNIGIDSEDNLYITGVSKDVCHNCSSYYHNFLNKYSAQGTLIWSQIIDFVEVVAVTDGFGNTFVTSGSKLSKYDTQGQLKWSRSEPTAGFNNITLHPEGGIVVSGFEKLSGTPLSVIARYDTDGNQVWIKSCSMLASGSRPNIVHADKSGNVFLAGGYDDTASFYKAQLFKFNSQGSQLFVKNIKHNPISIKTDVFGNIYSLGEWFLDKYSELGILEWRKTFSGPVVNLKEIAMTKSNDIVLAGNFSSGSSQIKVDNTSLTGNYNLFIMTIDQKGQILNVIQNSKAPDLSTNSFMSFVHDIEVNNNDDILITGSFSGNGYLGQTLLSAPQEQPFYNDLLLAKVGFSQTEVSVKEIITQSMSSFEIFPNPGSGLFTLKFEGTENKRRMTVINLLGSVLLEEEVKIESDGYNNLLDLQTFPKGVYFVVIEGNENRESRKIIIQ